MATYKIKDVSYNVTYTCADDDIILDRAEQVGLDYPYSDRAGASSSSVAFLLSGKIDDEGSFLSESARQRGFFHTDSTYPLSDLEIVSLGMEEQFKLYEENPDKWVYPGHVDI